MVWMMQKANQNPVTQFAEDVLNERLDRGVCKWERLACERHMKLLGRNDLYFDDENCERVIKFFRLCRHWQGECGGQPIELAPFQKFALGSVFGWKVKETNLRLFRSAFLFVPRKQGKTTIAGGMAVYLAAFDGEPGADVYMAATAKEQAMLAYRNAENFISKSPGLKSHCTVRYRHIKTKTNGIIRAVSSKTNNQDGYNPHGAIYDELHQWPMDGELRHVIRSGMAARAQPLEFGITTAGKSLNVYGKVLQDYCERVLDGVIEDDRTFALIYAPDKGDDYRDEKVWFKVNPIIVGDKIDKMRSLIKEADAGDPNAWRELLVKDLDVWLNEQDAWIEASDWKACGEKSLDIQDGAECYAGLDLATVSDVTALALMFEDGQVMMRYYVPGDGLSDRSAREHVPYDIWVASGIVTATPGRTTDFSFIERDILTLSKTYKIKALGYDPFVAHELIRKVQDEGVKCEKVLQQSASMDANIAALERKIMTAHLKHGNCPVLKWMASNARLITDTQGKRKLDKSRPEDKIDGIAALLNCEGARIWSTKGDKKEPQPYKTKRHRYV